MAPWLASSACWFSGTASVDVSRAGVISLSGMIPDIRGDSLRSGGL
jgi:hypothetical protein